MSTVAKILVVVNLLLAGAFVGSAASYLGHQDTWRGKFDAAQASYERQLADKDKLIAQAQGERDQARAAVKTADTNLAAESAKRQKLESENDHLRKAFDQQTAQLTRTATTGERMSASLESNRKLIDQLQKENRALYEENTALAEARDAAVEMGNSLDLQLRQETEARLGVEKTLAARSEALKRSTFENEAWRDRYPGDSISGAAQPAQKGRVMAADADTNVVIISLGAEDGVKKGYRFTVSRGANYVGTIQIRDVEAKKASGFALPDLQKDTIRPGDAIRTP